MSWTRRVWVTLGLTLLISVLSALVYYRALGLPFISDDYIQIGLARQWGPVEGWPDLARDVLYRSRATSLILTYWTEQAFGVNPFPFYLTTLSIHILNCLLIAALGVWTRIGWRVSILAACCFAVHKGHQEAVIWYAALPELLVFTFVLATVNLWLRWLTRGNGWFYAAAAATFLFALFSKESAVAVVPVLALTAWVERRRLSTLAWVAPFALVSAVYALLIFQAGRTHLHLNDGTFSLTAPVWIVLPRSILRMLIVSGLAAAMILIALRARQYAQLAAISVAWMVLTLLPYSFLTYMPFVPSRHTYMAGVGVATLIAASLLALSERSLRHRNAAIALAILFVIGQTTYIWTKKQEQFADRALPTERLIEYLAGVDEPVMLSPCFPYSKEVARWAARIRLDRDLTFYRVADGDPPDARAARFCEVQDGR